MSRAKQQVWKSAGEPTRVWPIFCKAALVFPIFQEFS
jgi:hypothetical protein